MRERTRIGNNQLQYEHVVSEQAQYQQAVFRTLLKWVSLICAILSLVYLAASIEPHAWPALVVGLTMLAVTGYSLIALRCMQPENFKTFARGWLSLATWTVCSFGLLQSDEFTNVMALGATIVIVLAIFLEPTRISMRWSVGNIAGYLAVIVVRSFIIIPRFDLGALHALVIYATPVAVLIILAAVGRVTIAYFKSNLIESEARRRQLESQDVRLRALMVEAESAREKAEQSDQIKSAFLASMSHELRTPLNAVINFTQFVIDGDTGEINDEQKGLLSEVVHSADHLLNLINDVLDMSKIESGSLNLFVEDGVNLDDMLKSVVSTGRSLIADKPVRLQASIDKNLPLIRADQQRIYQIMLNILSNACKFTDQGEIVVSARMLGDKVVLAVSDTGPGIAQDDFAKVFAAFKQTQTGLRQGGGTGLGMAISKSLAEAHGGCLWLESELGKGTTFSLSLPIHSEALMPVLA